VEDAGEGAGKPGIGYGSIIRKNVIKNVTKNVPFDARYTKGWEWIEREQRRTGSKCYSGYSLHYATTGDTAAMESALGSTMVIYSIGSVQLVLQWMDDQPGLPFDHVYR
jgi:hypothetical protein